ncbi:MAG TPA: arylsulfatase [Prolixibacteraceae bacterium]|nr:arylsulfatase [Prolixibacteraceae bacterium]
MNPGKPILTSLAALSFFLSGSDAKTGGVKNLKPNIVYILADDLGYGDLSCYGQKKFKTPNIDRLASQGMLFTQHYSGSTVCAPSRSSLMTGLHTGHTPIRGNKGWKPEGEYPISASAFTLAEMLKQAGYTTGAFGKWGLGFIGTEGDPNQQGFDEFFGFNSQNLAHNYYPEYLWDNDQKLILKGNSDNQSGQYAPELIHKRALQFIGKNDPSKTGKPFFLFYPNTIPHAELSVPEENLKEFRGKLMPEKIFKGVEPKSETFRKGGYGRQNETHAAFAAMVTLLDKQVGEVVAKLKELGLDKNTIIIFSSDNGPHLEGGADPDYFDSNGPLKGYKRDLYEGGIRVPMIACWPGIIRAGSTTDHVSAFWDVMPTVAEITGIPAPENLDGISFLPTLTGQAGQKQHESMYWEFHELKGRQALRMGNWKLVRYNVLTPDNTTTELYDLKTDLGEEKNIAGNHPELVKKMIEILNHSRIPSEVFNFMPEFKFIK